MAKYTIHVEPSNGISIPHLGHMKHGENTVELTDEQLADLQGAEGIRIDGASAAASGKPSDPDELMAAIADAIGTLDPSDESLWTKQAGVPTTAAVEAVLGYNITAAERDAALQQ